MGHHGLINRQGPGKWRGEGALKGLQPPLPPARKYLPFSDGKLHFEKKKKTE